MTNRLSERHYFAAQASTRWTEWKARPNVDQSAAVAVSTSAPHSASELNPDRSKIAVQWRPLLAE